MAAPKRDEERRRRNPSGHQHIKPEELPFEVNTEPEIPEAGDQWHPIALQLYNSIATSPARMFMYDFDWAWAYTLCESLSRELKPQVVGITERKYDEETGEFIDAQPVFGVIPMKGASLQAYIKAFGSLGCTETDRLRMQVEVPRVGSARMHAVQPAEGQEGVVMDFAEARRRSRLGGGE